MATSCLASSITTVPCSYVLIERKSRFQGPQLTLMALNFGTLRLTAPTFPVLLITMNKNSTALSAQSESSEVQSPT